jgi:Holliday junction resolvase
MALYRRAAKRDDAEPAVVERLRQLGASVARVSGEDTPDLLVGWRGHTYLAEVKTGKAKLKPGQAEFARAWRGSPIATLRTPQEATDWLLGLARPPVVERVLDQDEVAAVWAERKGL